MAKFQNSPSPDSLPPRSPTVGCGAADLALFLVLFFTSPVTLSKRGQVSGLFILILQMETYLSQGGGEAGQHRPGTQPSAGCLVSPQSIATLKFNHLEKKLRVDFPDKIQGGQLYFNFRKISNNYVSSSMSPVLHRTYLY
jgi:hypothetical protein